MALSSPDQPSAKSFGPSDDGVLASFRCIVLREADEIHVDSMVGARKLLEDLAYTGPEDCTVPDDLLSGSKLRATKHALLRARLQAWHDSIKELVKRQVCALAGIAKNKSYCPIGQESSWARLEVEVIWSQSLARALAPNLPVKLLTPDVVKPLGLVEHWSRFVCDGVLAYLSSWCAPIWYTDPILNNVEVLSWIDRIGPMPSCLDERRSAGLSSVFVPSIRPCSSLPLWSRGWRIVEFTRTGQHAGSKRRKDGRITV